MNAERNIEDNDVSLESKEAQPQSFERFALTPRVPVARHYACKIGVNSKVRKATVMRLHIEIVGVELEKWRPPFTLKGETIEHSSSLR